MSHTASTATNSDVSAAAGDVVLITGASRGIGLSLVKAFSAAGSKVIAAVRTPSKATDLYALASKAATGSITVIQLDVSDAKSIEALPKVLDDLKVGRIDVLLNNAGIQSSLGLGELLDTAKRSDWYATFETNVIGVWDVTRVVLSRLRQSSTPRIINIGSGAGSIQLTANAAFFAGRLVSYRVSKAALNELTAVQAAEYNASSSSTASSASTTGAAASSPIITVLSINPGMVDTDMGEQAVVTLIKAGMKKPDTISPDQSAAAIASLVTAAKAKPNPIAVFLNYDGSPLPW